jgi:hypothetical protein
MNHVNDDNVGNEEKNTIFLCDNNIYNDYIHVLKTVITPEDIGHSVSKKIQNEKWLLIMN